MAPNDLIELVVELSKRLEEQAQQLEAQAERIRALENREREAQTVISISGREKRVESAEVQRRLQRREAYGEKQKQTRPGCDRPPPAISEARASRAYGRCVRSRGAPPQHV